LSRRRISRNKRRKPVLVDSSPIVAFLKGRDRSDGWIKRILSKK